MKGFSRLFFFAILTIAMLVVSACGATTQFIADGGSAKPLPSLVPVSGVIEAINGNQWTIDGKVVTVDSSMLDDDDDLDNYQIGDYVEIQAEEQADGSLIARKVDSSDDGNENDDSNSNDDDSSNSNDDNSNSNDDSSNSNDDDSNSNDDDSSNSNDDSNSNNDDSSNSNDDDSNNNDDDSSNSNDNGSNNNDDDSNDNDDD